MYMDFSKDEHCFFLFRTRKLLIGWMEQMPLAWLRKYNIMQMSSHQLLHQQINRKLRRYICFSVWFMACAMPQDSKELIADGEKLGKNCLGTGDRGGSGDCKHYFQYLIPVYQPLVYPMISQSWQFMSTLMPNLAFHA